MLLPHTEANLPLWDRTLAGTSGATRKGAASGSKACTSVHELLSLPLSASSQARLRLLRGSDIRAYTPGRGLAYIFAMSSTGRHALKKLVQEFGPILLI